MNVGTFAMSRSVNLKTLSSGKTVCVVGVTNGKFLNNPVLAPDGSTPPDGLGVLSIGGDGLLRIYPWDPTQSYGQFQWVEVDGNVGRIVTFVAGHGDWQNAIAFPVVP